MTTTTPKGDPETTTTATTPTTPTTTMTTTTLEKETTSTPPETGKCDWPSGTLQHTLITKLDAVVAAHTVPSRMSIGGTLYDGSPSSSVTVGGFVTYGARHGGMWNFAKGSKQGPIPFDWAMFEWLAQNAEDLTSGGYKIKVFTKGGDYDLFDIKGSSGQGMDYGKSLMIFRTDQDINLKGAQDGSGRQFGASVLAPYSKVTLDGSAAYVDGCVVAKSFGSSDGSLQMHGACYKGPWKCGDGSSSN